MEKMVSIGFLYLTALARSLKIRDKICGDDP